MLSFSKNIGAHDSVMIRDISAWLEEAVWLTNRNGHKTDKDFAHRAIETARESACRLKDTNTQTRAFILIRSFERILCTLS